MERSYKSIALQIATLGRELARVETEDIALWPDKKACSIVREWTGNDLLNERNLFDEEYYVGAIAEALGKMRTALYEINIKRYQEE